MKKNKILAMLILLAVLLALGIFLYLKNKNSIYDSNGRRASLGNCVFNIEAVSGEDDRKKGLAGRDTLCNDCGMLFVFDKEGDYFFWMKDMRFPIDIIWLRDNKVVDIIQNVNHQSKNVYDSNEKSDKVLELNANDASRCEIQVGDKLKK
jgi:uncharacterized membrane protein (UPF0127 family)